MGFTSTFKCPTCGAPVDVRSDRSKSVVCLFCRTQVNLTLPERPVMATLPDTPFAHPLALGMRGTLRGAPFQIAGHIRYTQPDWHWDEYLLVADDGQTAWLEYDEGFTLYRPFTPSASEPITNDTRELVADGARSRVTEHEHARITHIEGELPFVGRVGDLIEYFDGHTLSVEVTDGEIEWFRVSTMPHAEVAAAFGVTPEELASRCYQLDDDGNEVPRGRSGRATSKGGQDIATIGIGIVALLIFLVCAGAFGDSDDDGDAYRGGGHGHFGGYSGGK